MLNHPLQDDLDFILQHTASEWESIRHQEIFITGGTGFFGCWLLESFLYANERFKLNAKATVLTRSIDAFAKKYPRLCHAEALYFIEGDVKNFIFPNKTFSHVIHAAADASTPSYLDEATLDVIIQGTKHTLDFAKHCKAEKILFVSSGAVYGRQPSTLLHIEEQHEFFEDIEGRSAYATGKRVAEEIALQYTKEFGLNIKIARCFAFTGAYLPFDSVLAIGNFIQASLAGNPMVIHSDGSSMRSYLYAADLMVWLWMILFKGKAAHPYNVGSEVEISILDLAKTIASTYAAQPEIQILKSQDKNKERDRYVPSTKRAQDELGLKQCVNLLDAIQKTKEWYAIHYEQQLKGQQHGN